MRYAFQDCTRRKRRTSTRRPSTNTGPYRRSNFHWLIAEYDPQEELAFGYANLNDREMAEWGYVSWKEVRENGGLRNATWKPCRLAIPY